MARLPSLRHHPRVSGNIRGSQANIRKCWNKLSCAAVGRSCSTLTEPVSSSACREWTSALQSGRRERGALDGIPRASVATACSSIGGGVRCSANATTRAHSIPPLLRYTLPRYRISIGMISILPPGPPDARADALKCENLPYAGILRASYSADLTTVFYKTRHPCACLAKSPRKSGQLTIEVKHMLHWCHIGYILVGKFVSIVWRCKHDAIR